MKTTDLLSGFFNVRKYQEGKPRDQWKIKADDDNISFSAVVADAGKFSQFAKPFMNREGEQLYRVTFKIGCNCRWYDDTASQVARPANADLDGKRFTAKIQYNTLVPADPNGKAARGYWVNAIMFRQEDANPFAAMEGSANYVPLQQPVQQPMQQPYQQPMQQPIQQPMQQQQPVPENVQAFFKTMSPRQVDKDDLPY